MTDTPTEQATRDPDAPEAVLIIHGTGTEYNILVRDYVNADELAEMIHYRIERHPTLTLAEKFSDVFHYEHPDGNQTAVKVSAITGYEVHRL